MPIIDTLIVTGIIIAGLFIFYKALKEPMDAFFSLIKKGIDYIKEQIGNQQEDTHEEIVYG